MQHQTSFSHRARLLLLLLAATTSAQAQFDVQDSHTTASFRGIHSLGNGVAWASGTDGTVLRTLDGGTLWQPCSTPPGAEKLDFRGIQAFDQNTAVVMSSGKGDLSRLYKTTDGCRTWRLLFTNPDKPEGFFDALLMLNPQNGVVLGDSAPAELRNPLVSTGLFRVRVTNNGGQTWMPITDEQTCQDSNGGVTSVRTTPGNGLSALHNESFFAASNSSIVSSEGRLYLATSQGRLLSTAITPSSFLIAACGGQMDPYSGACIHPWPDWHKAQVPIRSSTDSAGIFSIAASRVGHLVAVGGDYKRSDVASETAAFSTDGGQHWTAAINTPHGYRSSVAYDPRSRTWITVGPNGTDISRDDGRNWTPLKSAANHPPDTDNDWNALSLPFVVGPHGRIGKLRADALVPAQP